MAHATFEHWPIETWVFPDATARAASTGFNIGPGDAGKIAFETATGTYWRLTSATLDGVPTWLPVGSGGGGGGGSATIWEPVTNGDPDNPEIVFDSNGEVVMSIVTY